MVNGAPAEAEINQKYNDSTIFYFSYSIRLITTNYVVFLSLTTLILRGINRTEDHEGQ